jgi:hypothetical protein
MNVSQVKRRLKQLHYLRFFYYSAKKHNIFAHNKAVSLSEINSSDILKHIGFNERSKHANFTLGRAFPSTIVLADD